VANAAGETQVIKMGQLKGLITTARLKSGSYLGRLWGSIAGGWGVGGSGAGGARSGNATGSAGSGFSAKDNVSPEAPVSLVVQAMNCDVFAFGLCRDNKLRMWSTSKNDELKF